MKGAKNGTGSYNKIKNRIENIQDNYLSDDRWFVEQVQKWVKRMFLRNVPPCKVSDVVYKFEKVHRTELGALLKQRARLLMKHNCITKKLDLNRKLLVIESLKYALSVSGNELNVYLRLKTEEIVRKLVQEMYKE